MRYLMALLLITCHAAADAVLQGDISITPIQTGNPAVIEPGTEISFSVDVFNSGESASHAGTLFIRYVFTSPLQERESHELFRTEELTLPSIPPDSHHLITFKKRHKWPSIFDFIRDNWPRRQYQAVATIADSPYIIGTAAIAFSMHYYPGPKHTLPQIIH